MSSLPPPPPPPSVPYGGPPPGAVTLGAAPTDTSGLRTAAIVLFWCVTGATALLTIAMFSRRSVWDRFGDNDASFSDLDDADGFVGAAALLVVGLALAAVIVVSIWSLRTARHARQTGATNVSSGLACGGWYIPFAAAIVPFVQLRRIADHRRRPRRWVNVWQGLFIASYVVGAGTRNAGVDVNTAESFDDVANTLTIESAMGVASTLLLALTAFFAARAMKDVDAVAR